MPIKLFRVFLSYLSDSPHHKRNIRGDRQQTADYLIVRLDQHIVNSVVSDCRGQQSKRADNEHLAFLFHERYADTDEKRAHHYNVQYLICPTSHRQFINLLKRNCKLCFECGYFICRKTCILHKEGCSLCKKICLVNVVNLKGCVKNLYFNYQRFS